MTALLFSLALASELRMHFFDVGDGDSTLIVCPDNSAILIDAGSAGRDKGQKGKKLAASLRARIDNALPDGDLAQRDLEAVVLTHPDPEHYSLLRDTLYGTRIGLVMFGGKLSSYSAKQRPAEERLATSVWSMWGFDLPSKPSNMLGCGDAKIWVLASNVPGKGSRADDTSSVVLRIEYGNFSAILGGDGTMETEAAVLGAYSDRYFLQSTLLKLPDGGTPERSGSEFLAAVKPQIAITSALFADPGNKDGAPRATVLDRLDDLDDVASHAHSSCSAEKACVVADTQKAMFTTALPYADGLFHDIVVRTDGNTWAVEQSGATFEGTAHR